MGALEGNPFDACVTDLKMPGMDGRQLHDALVQLRPELRRRVVILTGNVLEDEMRAWLEENGVAHVAKPFRVRELRKLVRRLIDEA